MISQSRIDFVDAIDNGDAEKVEQLLASGAVAVDDPLLRDFAPALLLAVRSGHNAIVELILKFGAQIDACDRGGDTACHVAADRNDADVLALLLAHSPTLTLENKLRDIPLEIALRHRCPHTVALLVQATPSVNPRMLCEAAALGAVVIQALVNCGVDVGKLRDSVDRTPLFYLFNHSSPAVVAALVECGVDLNATEQYGFTPSSFAIDHGRADLLRLFIDSGADVWSTCEDGLHLLHIAAQGRDARCTLMLLAVGVDVHARCRSLSTACQRAVIRSASPRFNASLTALMAAGADFDEPLPESFGFAGDKATPRRSLADAGVVIADDDVDAARRAIANLRLGWVRPRALQVCIGLQSRGLDALQTCEILVHACGPAAPMIPFHIWWKIATTVKHFVT